jgi:hypothetical protein
MYIFILKDQHLPELNKNQVQPYGTDCSKQNKSFDSQERNCKMITKESLTPTDRRILYEETLSTENALVAVLGYDVQDG